MSRLGYLIAPFFQPVDIDGRPLSGGKVVVFKHNTTERYITFSDFEGTENPPEVVLDSRGSAVIIASSDYTYDVIVYNRFGGEFMSRQNVCIVEAGAEALTTYPLNIKDSGAAAPFFSYNPTQQQGELVQNSLTLTKGGLSKTYKPFGDQNVSFEIPDTSLDLSVAPQTWTNDQKIQARLNIGAVSQEDITNAINSLDVAGVYEPGYFVVNVKQVDGKIIVQKTEIPIRKVVGLEDALDAKYTFPSGGIPYGDLSTTLKGVINAAILREKVETFGNNAARVHLCQIDTNGSNYASISFLVHFYNAGYNGSKFGTSVDVLVDISLYSTTINVSARVIGENNMDYEWGQPCVSYFDDGTGKIDFYIGFVDLALNKYVLMGYMATTINVLSEEGFYNIDYYTDATTSLTGGTSVVATIEPVIQFPEIKPNLSGGGTLEIKRNACYTIELDNEGSIIVDLDSSNFADVHAKIFLKWKAGCNTPIIVWYDEALGQRQQRQFTINQASESVILDVHIRDIGGYSFARVL